MHKLMDIIYSKQINTNGLVLRGWYTSLTLAVYGTAERPHGHDQSSPPPPPPPPPQQPSGPKRIIKQGGHLLKKIITMVIIIIMKPSMSHPDPETRI